MKRTIILSFAMLAAIVANAQEAMSKAIDTFVETNYNYITKLSSSNWPLSDGGKGEQKSYYFTLPKDKQDLLSPIMNGFKKDKPKAYGIYSKKAGESDMGISIGYGQNNSNTYRLGSHKKRNYEVVYIRDPKNEKYRSVYALVWYDDDNNTVSGSVHKTYGADPKKEKPKRTFIINGKKYDEQTLKDWDFNMDFYREQIDKFAEEIEKFGENITNYNKSIEDYKEKIEEKREQIAELKAKKPRNYKEKINTLETEIASYQSAIKGYESGIKSYEDGIESLKSSNKNMQGFVDDYDSKTSLAISTNRITTAEQFLSQFGNTRTVFLKYVQSSDSNPNMLTGLANKMVALSKKAKEILSREERETCKIGLSTMIKSVSDEYVVSLLNLAKSNY